MVRQNLDNDLGKIIIALGIVSSSHGCDKGIGLYSKLSVHIDWIRSHVKETKKKSDAILLSSQELDGNSVIIAAS